MSDKTKELQLRIESMNDFQLLRFFEAFSNQILNNIDTSLEDIIQNLPSSVQLMPEILGLSNLDEQTANMDINQNDAALFVRELLYIWSEDEKLSVILGKHLDEYKDHAMSVEVILAIGAAMSMVLVTLGNRNLSFKGFGVNITISTNNTTSPEQIIGVLPNSTSTILQNNHLLPLSTLELLKKGEIEAVLNQLEKLNTNDKNVIVSLQARFNQWVKNKNLGLFPSSDAEIREYNQILYAVISIIE